MTAFFPPQPNNWGRGPGFGKAGGSERRPKLKSLKTEVESNEELFSSFPCSEPQRTYRPFFSQSPQLRRNHACLGCCSMKHSLELPPTPLSRNLAHPQPCGHELPKTQYKDRVGDMSQDLRPYITGNPLLAIDLYTT